LVQIMGAGQDHHGKDTSDVLIWQAETRVMNPTISEELIARDMNLDPEAARSEWLAEFRSDLETFIDAAALENVVIQNRFELPPRLASNLNLRYQAFVDPSGGRKDSAALAISHKEKDTVVIDLARRWPSPHNPKIVTEEMSEILENYGIRRVTGDRYAGAWPEQEFKKHHIRYETSPRNKSELYLDFLPLIMGGQIELLDNKTLLNELRSLERRTRSAGRDLIDHPPRGHDDLANAVAGVAVSLGKAKKIAGPVFRRR
jgi:hypothetical protein